MGSSNKEHDTLVRQKTWTLVPLPPGRNLIPGRFILVTKDTDPPIKKARWVAKGFHQRLGEDYLETFANTANPVIIRLLPAYVALYGWEIM